MSDGFTHDVLILGSGLAGLRAALQISVIVTGIALAVFGAVMGHFTGVNKFKSAFQTLLVGGLAAGAAFALARAFG